MRRYLIVANQTLCVHREPRDDERLGEVRFLVRDRDAKFSGPFDEVLRTEGARIIRTPIRAPRANAFAERFVRTVRSECLDHVLVHGRRHLERVLKVYVAHYMKERPHRGLAWPYPPVTEHRRSGGTIRTPWNEGTCSAG